LTKKCAKQDLVSYAKLVFSTGINNGWGDAA